MFGRRRGFFVACLLLALTACSAPTAAQQTPPSTQSTNPAQSTNTPSPAQTPIPTDGPPTDLPPSGPPTDAPMPSTPCPDGRPSQCVPIGEIPKEGAEPPSSAVVPGNPQSYTVEQYLDFIVGDLDKNWSSWFKRSGYAEPWVYIEKIEPGRSAYMGCGAKTLTSETPNAYYCGSDTRVVNGATIYGVVYLPVLTMRKMWTGNVFERTSRAAGDFAAAILVAHEFGHHIQDEIAIQSRVAAPTGKNKELIADCFAGVWMATAYYEGLLTDTDYAEAVAALEAIGDPPGSNGTDPHGTSAERSAALKIGYNGYGQYKPGTPQACYVYWK